MIAGGGKKKGGPQWVANYAVDSWVECHSISYMSRLSIQTNRCRVKDLVEDCSYKIDLSASTAKYESRVNST